MPIIVRPNNFEAVVLGAKGPILIDFFGENCMPCRILRPILMELSQEYDGITYGLFKTDREPWETDKEFEEKFAVLAALGVMHLPTMLLFINGVLVQTIVGLHTKEELLEIFTELGLALKPVKKNEPDPDGGKNS